MPRRAKLPQVGGDCDVVSVPPNRKLPGSELYRRVAAKLRNLPSCEAAHASAGTPEDSPGAGTPEEDSPGAGSTGYGFQLRKTNTPTAETGALIPCNHTEVTIPSSATVAVDWPAGTRLQAEPIQEDASVAEAREEGRKSLDMRSCMEVCMHGQL